jgi:putative isomerase
MQLDLRHIIFSRPSTWLEVARREAGEGDAAIYIRTMHADANPREVFRVIPLGSGGEPVMFHESATPAAVTLETKTGKIELVLDDEGCLRIRGLNAGFRLYRTKPNDKGYNADYPFHYGEGRIQVNAFRSRMQYMISILAGRSLIDAPWDEVTCSTITLDFVPEAVGGVAEIVMEAFTTSWTERIYGHTFDECLAEAEEAFKQWLQDTSPEDAGYPDVRKLAAYTQYAPLVPPSGLLQRQTMLISPAFNGVWSWDHCFNAMALAGRRPQMAWDQLMVPFDHQDAYGALPDYVKDREMVWNFTKPPIHGWTLRRMLERTNAITTGQLAAFYPKLSAWTEWWFKYRDYDRNGIPQYNHGNDSGWDNALVFREAGAVECPDLSAFLVIQMDVLADVADLIGRSDDASAWRQRSDGLLAKMLDYFWNGEKFIAKRSGSGDIINTDSLLHWIPIVLGSRLPQEIIRRTAAVLGPDGPFLTEWGLATECPASPHYRPDGYWRGPIWAPSTFIVADGLKHAGELELAREIARRFCRLCEPGGMAENFNALTGEGQRDRFHTWPASVFLMFARDYM